MWEITHGKLASTWYREYLKSPEAIRIRKAVSFGLLSFSVTLFLTRYNPSFEIAAQLPFCNQKIL